MLRDALDRTLEGQRRIVFVTGEAGIGKTTAVELFLEESAAAQPLVFGRGQCVEHSGSGMAFLPVLEALERICPLRARSARARGAARRTPRRGWCSYPVSLAPDDRADLEQSAQTATQERRFRELAQALELLTVDDPLALWLEDLHWCDPETVALLSFLARRTEPARLLIIGTYRAVEVIVHQHRIKALAQELHAHGTAAMVLLPFLSPRRSRRTCASASRRRRLAGRAISPRPCRIGPKGSPLFMVRVLDYAVAQGILALNGDQWQLATTAADLATLFPTACGNSSASNWRR